MFLYTSSRSSLFIGKTVILAHYGNKEENTAKTKENKIKKSLYIFLSCTILSSIYIFSLCIERKRSSGDFRSHDDKKKKTKQRHVNGTGGRASEIKRLVRDSLFSFLGVRAYGCSVTLYIACTHNGA